MASSVFDAYCMCSSAVNVGTDQISYTVLEDAGQLEVTIRTTSGQMVSGLECQIEVVTNAESAIGELMIIV